MRKLPFLKRTSNLLRIPSLLTAIGLLTSCAVQNQRVAIYENIDLSPSLTQAFLSKDFIPAEWENESWWEMFSDPQLNAFIETALADNPSLQAAFERVSMAHETAKQNFSSLLPAVDIDYKQALMGFHWNREGVGSQVPVTLSDGIIPGWINALSYFLNFRWALDIWGKQTKLYKAALDEMKASLAQAAYTKLLLSIQVATTYIHLQMDLRIEALQNEKLNLQQQIMKIKKQMVEIALLDELDLCLLSQNIQQSQIQLLETQNQLATDQYHLKVLMGQSPDASEQIQVPIADFGQSFPFPDSVSIDLLARRPDVVSKIWTIQAAIKRVNSAKVSFLPSIDLSSLIGYMLLQYDTLLQPRGWFTSILPGASLPVFQGLNLRSKLKKSLRDYNLAVLDYNQLILNAAQDVVDSITSFKIANQKLDQQIGIVQDGQALLELTGLRYEYGLDTYLDLLESQINLLDQQMKQQQCVSARLLCVLNLIKAIGGGYNNPEAQLDMQQDFIYE